MRIYSALILKVQSGVSHNVATIDLNVRDGSFIVCNGDQVLPSIPLT